MAERSDKIAMFMEVTGMDDQSIAEQYLEASNWDLGDAIQTATSEEGSFEVPERVDASAPPASAMVDALVVDDDDIIMPSQRSQPDGRLNGDDEKNFHDAVSDNIYTGSDPRRRARPNRFSPLADDVSISNDSPRRKPGASKFVADEKSFQRVPSEDSDVVLLSPKQRADVNGKKDGDNKAVGSYSAFQSALSSGVTVASSSSSSSRPLPRLGQPLAAGESSSVLPSSAAAGTSGSGKPYEVSVADEDDSDEDITDEDEVISINDDAINSFLRPPSPKTASRPSVSPKHGVGESSSSSSGPNAHKAEFIPALAPAEGPTIEIFRSRFTDVYGDKAEPLFFIGSLQEAMLEAFESRNVDSRRMLAIYLHNVRSVAVNVFVNNVLLDDEVINVIAQHLVLWPWDCTAPENRIRFDALLAGLMPGSSHNVQQYPEDAFPYILIFDKHKAQVMELMAISGHQTKYEVVQRLMNCVQMHEGFIQQDEQEEIQRIQRLEEREEMNKAFEESLAADRAKEQSKRDDEQRAREAEQTRLEQIRLAEVERQKMESELMPEPPAMPSGSKGADDVVVIRIRTPEGQNLIRRFYRNQPLSDLVKYAHAKGYGVNEWSLKTQYPSRDLSQIDGKMLLSELKMGKTENVFVEQR